MTKGDLVRALAERAGMTQRDARCVVDALFAPEGGLVVEALVRDGRMTLAGFGTLEMRTHAARPARDPATGETIVRPASERPAFRPAPALLAQLDARR